MNRKYLMILVDKLTDKYKITRNERERFER